MEKVKAFFKRTWELFKSDTWCMIFVVFVSMVLGASLFGGSSEPASVEPEKAITATQPSTAPTIAASVSDAIETQPEQQPEETQQTQPELTMGQQQAIQKAKAYLNYSAFSRSGLIEQLKYEGFSSDDATFAVDNIAVDWNEQAAKKAKAYLDYSSFSRSGLIEQLEFEGFSHEQAEYGATAVGY